MSWKDGFNAALLKFVQKEFDADATEVTNFYNTTRNIGYCETCSYEIACVEITWRTTDGRSRSGVAEKNFAELISELTE